MASEMSPMRATALTLLTLLALGAAAPTFHDVSDLDKDGVEDRCGRVKGRG